MNSEQQSARKNGRTVVEVRVTLYIETLDDDEALTKADQWVRSLHGANYGDVQALRENGVSLSSWDAAIPSGTPTIAESVSKQVGNYNDFINRKGPDRPKI